MPVEPCARPCSGAADHRRAGRVGYVRQASRRRVSRDGRRGLSGRATGLLPEAGFYESGRRLAGAVVGLVDLRTPRDLHGPADELPDVVMLRLTGQGDVVAWCIEEALPG